MTLPSRPDLIEELRKSSTSEVRSNLRRPRNLFTALRRRLGHDPDQPPVLILRQRPRLHDLDGVADVRLVLLVVDVADGAALDVLAVALVLNQARNLDAASLLHLVAGDDAGFDPAFAARFFGHTLSLFGGL